MDFEDCIELFVLGDMIVVFVGVEYCFCIKDG